MNKISLMEILPTVKVVSQELATGLNECAKSIHLFKLSINSLNSKTAISIQPLFN